MKSILFFYFLIVTGCVLAQPGVTPTEVLNGKKYYLHKVEAGNTLFGLQRVYGVPVEQIVKTNPGSENGLVVGQIIRIEVPLETVVHEVQKKETLFAISKKYGVTVESILAANPGAENGINVGQKLKIPGVEKGNVGEVIPPKVDTQKIEPVKVEELSVPQKEIKVSFTDSILDHTVLDHETLYSISKRFMVPVEELQRVNGLKSSKIKPGDVLKIPLRKERLEMVEVRSVPEKNLPKVDSSLLYPKKNSYKVAILLPFNLDKGVNDPYAGISADFYMGVKLALDSLEAMGLKAEVFVHDTKADTLALKKILSKPELSSMDLIIGPLLTDGSDIIARWAKEKNIRVVCPVASNTTMLKGNPFVYHAVPSDATLMQGLARYTLEECSRDQIILIKPTNDKLNYESFRNAFLSSSFSGVRPKLIEATPENFSTYLKKGINSTLIFPSSDRKEVLKFHNTLSSGMVKLGSTSIHVLGVKEWVGFEGLNLNSVLYSFGYAAPNEFTYESEKVKILHKKYRSLYMADMSKISVQGFDVTFHFLSEMLLQKKVKSNVMNDFKMTQAGVGNGYENSKVFIMRLENGEFIPLRK
jgi:LysM repeat protein